MLGPRNDCYQRSGKKYPGCLSCKEVTDLLGSFGVTDFEKVSKCLMSGMMQGFIKIPEGGNLDSVLFDWEG